MSMLDRIAKAVLAGKPGGPHPGGIRAYHSSPHDFDKFDLSKIGTGEGAQVYGHGIYFAENPAVSGQGGQYWNQFLSRFPETELATAERLKAANFDREKAIAETQRRLNDLYEWGDSRQGFLASDKVGRQMHERKLSELDARLELLRSDKPIGSRTYEVNINARPELFLDWDKPVKQHPEVLEKIREGFPYYPFKPEESGQSIYTGFVGYPYSKPNTTREQAKAIISERLGEAGIPGIRYLDEGSRILPARKEQLENSLAIARSDPRLSHKVGEYESELKSLQPTSNYVVFDPSKLDIMAKYGVVGGAPIGMGVLAAQDQYGAQP